MRYHALATLTSALLSVGPAAATAQRLVALRAGVAGVKQSADAVRLITPLHVVESASAPPSRWPFVLGGALIGGVAAGAWYAHEVAKNDDPMIDLSLPVVGIGTGVGAFAGFLVGEVVRGARSPAPKPATELER
jgi:hypothetical protein